MLTKVVARRGDSARDCATISGESYRFFPTIHRLIDVAQLERSEAALKQQNERSGKLGSAERRIEDLERIHADEKRKVCARPKLANTLILTFYFPFSPI